MNTFSDWEKMYFLIWLNTFSNLDKYISDLEKCFFWFGQIHFLIWTNTFSELEKYSAPPWQMLGGRTLSMLAMRRPIYPENPPPLSLQPALAGKQEEFRLTWGILPLIGHTSVLSHILAILYLIHTTRAFLRHLYNLSDPCFNQRPVLFILKGKMSCGVFESSSKGRISSQWGWGRSRQAGRNRAEAAAVAAAAADNSSKQQQQTGFPTSSSC